LATAIYTYDSAGRRTSLTLPNGVLVEYAYDTASRLTSITYKQNGTILLGDLTYEYDKNGNRIKTGGSFARTGIPSQVSSTAYDAANEQTTFADKTLTYDNNGNVQTVTDVGGTTTYTWNARNQLVGISGPGVNATFVYDGVGRREAKTINGNLTEFLYDGLNPVQESSGTTILANVLPALRIDEFLTRTDVTSGVTSFFLADALGSPVAATDSSGSVQTEYTYEPFGQATVGGASNSNPYQYTGRENDGTGLYYYRARYYHPILQRFISLDPFPGFRTLPHSLNGYPYVLNNPQSLIDSDGQLPDPATFTGGAIIGGIASGIQTSLDGGSPGAIIYSTAIGAIVGGLTAPWLGPIASGLVGDPIGQMLDPSRSGNGDIPVISNVPTRPIPADPFADQKIGPPACPAGPQSKSER
jgi:RHS repeat-associated protein